MERPGLKFWIVLNLIMNLPMALAMSLAAGLLTQGIHMPGFLIDVLISFAVSCLICAAWQMVCGTLSPGFRKPCGGARQQSPDCPDL